MMDAIDALIAARVTKPAGITTNQVPVWNGSTFVAKNFSQVTTSALSGGPPGSPSDGDIWIATGVDGNGVRWAFQYNAGSASAYKWEFIGGAPMVARTTTEPSHGNNTNYENPTGISITNARAGDYTAKISARVTNSSAGILNVNYNVTAGAVNPSEVSAVSPAASAYGSASREERLLAVAASTAIQPRYQPTVAPGATGLQIGLEVLTVLPIRVS